MTHHRSTHDESAPDGEPALPDGILVARLCGGDLDSLGILFDRYYPQVYRAAAGITRDPALADDVAQDCFLRLHQYVQRIDTRLPLMPWLYRVTVNLAYTATTRRAKRRVSLDDLIDRLMTPLNQGPDHLAEMGEIKGHVHQAIAGLRFEQRVVVVLHYLNEQSVEEIAAILQCPIGTVKSRLHYARLKLRGSLGDLRTENYSGRNEDSYDEVEAVERRTI
ncbi:MAG: RNA polymerase sigma factor [Chloroflexota bacterium]|nr:RNA polymerase sigma factor [Chloroflexota bacterium]